MGVTCINQSEQELVGKQYFIHTISHPIASLPSQESRLLPRTVGEHDKAGNCRALPTYVAVERKGMSVASSGVTIIMRRVLPPLLSLSLSCVVVDIMNSIFSAECASPSNDRQCNCIERQEEAARIKNLHKLSL